MDRWVLKVHDLMSFKGNKMANNQIPSLLTSFDTDCKKKKKKRVWNLLVKATGCNSCFLQRLVIHCVQQDVQMWFDCWSCSQFLKNEIRNQEPLTCVWQASRETPRYCNEENHTARTETAVYKQMILPFRKGHVCRNTAVQEMKATNADSKPQY